MNKKEVTIIGAGLAGCEAALVLSRLNTKVNLIECKPHTKSPAHKIDSYAELVCSNSLKSNDLSTASGLLKQELRVLNSPLINVADNCAVGAGGALAVDRLDFSKKITSLLNSNPNITLINKLVTNFDDSIPLIIATGPLTMNPFYDFLEKKLGECLHFFDAAAPIVSGETLNFEHTFNANRYNKGEAEYVNCPLDKQQYQDFVNSLINAETALLHDFEKRDIFEGCMPIEVMAKRGIDTLRFGPLRPVGLYDENGKRPYAVVQLRRENASQDMFNIVGFQTSLKFSEQKRVFGMIPALKNAEFLRYGVMHRNCFVNAPQILNADFSLKTNPLTFIAGQLSGVEGYCESIMSGHIAALFMHKKLTQLQNNIYKPDCNFDLKNLAPNNNTMCGAIINYITTENKNFQPINANFGLMPPLEQLIKDKKERKLAMSNRAISQINDFKNAIFIK